MRSDARAAANGGGSVSSSLDERGFLPETFQAATIEKEGWLQKWTNYIKGYRQRWFALDSQGNLSYYRFAIFDLFFFCLLLCASFRLIEARLLH